MRSGVSVGGIDDQQPLGRGRDRLHELRHRTRYADLKACHAQSAGTIKTPPSIDTAHDGEWHEGHARDVAASGITATAEISTRIPRSAAPTTARAGYGGVNTVR